jgi:Ferritin-like domain
VAKVTITAETSQSASLRRRPASNSRPAVTAAEGRGGAAVGQVLVAGAASRSTRSLLLKRGAVAGGALLAAGGLTAAVPAIAGPARTRAQDARILNFLLWLEYAQAAFYREALAADRLGGEALELAEALGQHEQAHVAFLQGMLGRQARAEPRFDFADAVGTEERFLEAADLLEETGVAAYIGQAPNLSRPRTTEIATVVSVEARHAAWVAAVIGQNPAPRAADASRTPTRVVSTFRRAGFLRS